MTLPVWTIPPNWQNGILERLEWLTDVLGNSIGAEQRRALRLSPRRTFEVDFIPTDQERAYLDLWLRAMGADEFMLPLWHDRGSLTTAIASGAVSLPIDTTYREFQVGDLAIIVGPDAFTFDQVTITAVAPDSLTVAAGGVTRDWAAGTVVHPLRIATLDAQNDVAALTGTVGRGTLRFLLNQENDIADEGTWDTLYAGYPVILQEPNRREDLKVTFQRNLISVDNETGLRELTDDAGGRAFTLQTHLLLLDGRAEHWAYRQMLYRLRGQQAAAWVPTFNHDLELSRDRVAADALLDIKQIGFGALGGPVSGRQFLLIDGTIIREITGTAAAPSPTEERLTLDSGLGVSLATGATASFMDVCRLAQDAIEIQHSTDTDGASESSISFRAFVDGRTAPDPIDYPIATTAKSVDMCGTPAEATCVGIDTGYWGELIVNLDLGPVDALVPGDAAVPNQWPASWTISLWRGGVEQVAMLNADNYSDYNGPDSSGFVHSWDSWFFDPASAAPRGEAGWATDPFAAGNPDTIKFDIQFGAEAVVFPGDMAGLMTVAFRRPNGSPVVGTVTVTTAAGAAYIGTPYARIEGTWPLHFEFSLPA